MIRADTSVEEDDSQASQVELQVIPDSETDEREECKRYELPTVSPVARYNKQEVEDLENVETELLNNLKLQLEQLKEVISTRDDVTDNTSEGYFGGLPLRSHPSNMMAVQEIDLDEQFPSPFRDELRSQTEKVIPRRDSQRHPSIKHSCDDVIILK